MVPSKTRRRRQIPWLLVFLTLPLILYVGRTPPPELPPPLQPLLRHVPETNYPPEAPPDFKRPLTLTAHARPENGSVVIVVFTTGVDTATFGRSFTAVGCLVGPHALPAERVLAAMVTCRIDRALLEDGMRVTVAIAYDGEVKEAMRGTQKIKGEDFTLYEGDVVPLKETPAELKDKASEVAAVRSLVTWHDGLLDVGTGRKHELCLMTAMKQYPFLLADWIGYYRRMGVDKFYIYENGAAESLKRLVGSEFVEVIRWPWARSQMQSNNHFLLASRTRCRYVAFFDADEFAMVGSDSGGAGLKRYLLLRFGQGYTQVVFHFVMMLNNGYVRRPKGALPELYTRREKDQEIKLGKSAIDREQEWEVHKIHMIGGTGAKTYWNTSLELEPGTLGHNAMLVHYTKRSWEDFVAKNRVGGASVMTKGRPPRELDIDKPDAEYMDESKSVEFDGFRRRWREIMKTNDGGGMTLTWREGEQVCRQVWCPRCVVSRLGEKKCKREGEA